MNGASVRPHPEGAVVQRHVGRSGRDLALAVVGAVLAVGAVVLAVAGQRTLPVLMAGGVGIAVLIPSYASWLRWHGLEVVVDDAGILFGSPRTPARPPMFSGLMRQAYRVGWDGFSEATIVDGAGAQMQQTMAPARVTTANGFFPRKGAPAHLSLLVTDPGRTPIPWQRTLRSGTFTMSSTPDPLNPSRRWVFPVRDADEIIAAFAARGQPLGRTTTPATPLPCPEWAAAAGPTA